MKILIIGAGELGSRHAQSLARIKEVKDLTLVDPCERSLEIAQERIHISGFRGEVTLLPSLTGSLGEVGLAVISTSSNERLGALNSAMKYASPKYVLLEKLLSPSIEQLGKFEEIFSRDEKKFWLNCPMPFFPHYQEVASMLDLRRAASPINYRVTGGDFGLVTNSIHYLEHFSRLTHAPIRDLNLDNTCKIVPSKRVGYSEIVGHLSGLTSNGDVFSVEFDKDIHGETLNIEISQGGESFRVDEIALTMNAKRLRGIEAVTPISTPRQSDLTHISLELLIAGNGPLWAQARNTIGLHTLIFKALEKVIENNEGLAYT